MSSPRATFCSKQQCQKFRITQQSSIVVHLFTPERRLHRGNYAEGGGRGNKEQKDEMKEKWEDRGREIILSTGLKLPRVSRHKNNHVNFHIRQDVTTRVAVMRFAYDNGTIEVCDYVCGFYLTPLGPPLPSYLPSSIPSTSSPPLFLPGIKPDTASRNHLFKP